ncbi:MAG: hypothetical protein IPG69_00940 [Flavobacteriales bacterium]|nr:hypothetical protein [Flavobacteriales bacterium]MBK7752378.1 hypothetical protein [Flavobacteriales bacterium]MBK9075370.1 hypothetical protein [Flavobacteriales bacterium]MBK9537675.1 hypothetical protein [Flavobacteriales bacterium]
MIRSTPALLVAISLFVACGSASPAGSKVKQPFSGSTYESNNRFFRGTGQGVSAKQNIARGKADLDAKNQLAGQVGTNMRAVTDQYLGQTENAGAADVADKFQSLVREVMNTELADLRKVGEETYHNAETGDYTVYVAYEIKKNAMLRFMKKKARTDAKVDELTLKAMDEILDKEIEKADAADKE